MSIDFDNELIVSVVEKVKALETRVEALEQGAVAVTPILEAWPANAFEPPKVPMPDTGGPVAGPGPGYVPWHPAPEDLPDFMEFFLRYGADKGDGVILPPADERVNFTWNTDQPVFGQVELIYPEPHDGKNPWAYEPFSVGRFHGDPTVVDSQSEFGGKQWRTAQMRKGKPDSPSWVNPPRTVLFDVVPEPTLPQEWDLWRAYLRMEHSYRVVIGMDKLPPGTRLKITRTWGFRPETTPEKPEDKPADNACGSVKRRPEPPKPLGPGEPEPDFGE